MIEPVIADPPSPSTQRARRSLEPWSISPETVAPTARFRPPHPLRSAALLLAPLPLPAALWASRVLPTPAALGFGVFLVVLALVQLGVGALDLHRSRRLADALLRAYPGLPPSPGLAAWRSAQLTSARSRRELKRHVRQLRRETEACRRSDTPAADSAVLEESVILLRQLECRLQALSEPVSPLGMLNVQSVATDEFSPLYFPERTDGLPAVLTQALNALEPA